MNKLGLIALSFCLFGFLGVEVWAGCCSYGGVPKKCEDTDTNKECKDLHGKTAQFFKGLICCPPDTDYGGKCKPNYDRCNKGNLVTLTNLAITPIQSGFEITWETRSERDNAGFFIWRGIKEGDEYKNAHRVSELIPAEGNLIGGATYSYQDTISDFQNGLVYCYGLEDVDNRGISAYHYDFIRCFPE